MKSTRILYTIIYLISVGSSYSHSFLNGDLEGVFLEKTPPDDWEFVSQNDINCSATMIGFATPDLTS